MVSYILEVCQEWELTTTALAASKSGLSLAARIYGPQSPQCKHLTDIVETLTKN